jgi:hypothetical protein
MGSEGVGMDVELDDGRVVHVDERPEHGAGSKALDFPPTGTTHAAMGAWLDRGDPRFLATHKEDFAGAAWLELDEANPEHARLDIVVLGSFRHVGLEAALAAALARAAARGRRRRLTAVVPHLSSDVLAGLRAAGFRITSCLSLGSVSELTLELD